MAEPQKQQKTKTVTGKKKNAFVANDFAKNLGTCAAIRATFNLGNFVGKGNSAKELAANTKIPNMEDVYEIACVNLPKEAWKGKSVDAIFSYLAAKKTLDAYKEAEKKVTTQKGEEITDEAVLKNPAVMKDSSGKAYYQKFKREMFAEFESGIDAARTELMQGKPITDPYTKEKVDASKASKILNGVEKAVNAAGSQIGYILGLDKSNRDIYSKMLFSVIGGGKKLWSSALKAAATAKAKNQEQGKEKPTEAKPEEQNKEAPAEEQKKETPAEEPRKEPEGQANNPEGEEPQKPASENAKAVADKIYQGISDLAKKPNENTAKQINGEIKNLAKLAHAKDNKIKDNASITNYRNALKVLNLESLMKSIHARTYVDFILAEQAIDLLEDEQNVNQERQPEKTVEKRPSGLDEVKRLIDKINSLIKIKDDKAFAEENKHWEREVIELINKYIQDEKLKRILLNGNKMEALCVLPQHIHEAYLKQQEEAKLDEETTEVANKFLNMLREKYK